MKVLGKGHLQRLVWRSSEKIQVVTRDEIYLRNCF